MYMYKKTSTFCNMGECTIQNLGIFFFHTEFLNLNAFKQFFSICYIESEIHGTIMERVRKWKFY